MRKARFVTVGLRLHQGNNRFWSTNPRMPSGLAWWDRHPRLSSGRSRARIGPHPRVRGWKPGLCAADPGRSLRVRASPLAPHPSDRPRRPLRRPSPPRLSMPDRHAPQPRRPRRFEAGGRVLEGHGLVRLRPEPLQGQPVGFGVGLGRGHVLLADDQSKASASPAVPRTVSTFSRQVVETTASSARPSEPLDQLGDARDRAAASRPAAVRVSSCLRRDPAVDVAALDPALGEASLARKDAVVLLGRAAQTSGGTSQPIGRTSAPRPRRGRSRCRRSPRRSRTAGRGAAWTWVATSPSGRTNRPDAKSDYSLRVPGPSNR